jgi:hypothetical protein
MPFDVPTRQRLEALVNKARAALANDVTDRLRRLGIQDGGVALNLDAIPGLTEADRVAGIAFRDLIKHHLDNAPGRPNADAPTFGRWEVAARADAYARTVRDTGFTALNRLVALRMAEEREVIGYPVLANGATSDGFRPFDKVANGALGDRNATYQACLETYFDELAVDLPSLFDRTAPEARYFPTPPCLATLLDALNAPDVVHLWEEDETIGWIYQYYNDRAERDRMRKASPAPRTSRELAVRNQFFTPRYVVEFLADNTLGRTWYEMRRGDTRLRDLCRYLVWRADDTFVLRGAIPPAPVEGQPDPIPYRRPKDPRDLRIIDPACGSGHFLLYAFDLLIEMYEEAWHDRDWPASEATGTALHHDYPTLEALRAAVPELVMRHNLHGIDIDRRAVQIAGVALWLRAHRAWAADGLDMADRPRIRRSNLVTAEPMPADPRQLQAFKGRIDPRLHKAVDAIWKHMAEAGDAGSLLPIEQRIVEEVASARSDDTYEPVGRLALPGVPPPTKELPHIADQLGLDLATEETRTFWQGANATLREALRHFSTSATAQATTRRLFAEDAAHGFAYIDLCHQRFDVVLMNPPFGKMAKGYEVQARADYPDSYNDILSAFVDRFLDRLHPGGLLGAITSRTCFFLSSFARWRQAVVRERGALTCMADLGERVMDQATVEAAAYCLRAGKAVNDAPVFRVLTDRDREQSVLGAIEAHRIGTPSPATFILDRPALGATGDTDAGGRPMAYWVPRDVGAAMQSGESFEPKMGTVRQGMATGANARFTRAWWEVQAESAQPDRRRWPWFVVGGGSQPWVAPLTTVVDWSTQGMEAIATGRGNGRPSLDLYFRPGLSWTRRAVRLVPYVIPAGCIPSTGRYMAFPKPGREFEAVGVLGTNVASAVARFPGEKFAWPNFLVETVRDLPWPTLSPELHARLTDRVEAEVHARRQANQRHEPFHDFTAPTGLMPTLVGNPLAYDPRSLLGDALDREVARAYGLDDAAYDTLVADLIEAVAFNQRGRGSGPTDGNGDNDPADPADTSTPDEAPEGDEGGDADDDDDAALRQVMQSGPRADAEALVSYAVGVAFGRWDVRIGADPSLAPALGGPFEALPPCPPGMLVGPDGLPATRESIASEAWLRARRVATTIPAAGDVAVPEVDASAYPVDVAWDGILVSDETDAQGAFDLTGRVRAAIVAACGGDGAAADDLIATACASLGVATLREYLHRPGGFFEAHVGRYTTKGRPPAPIYWPLVASRGRYVVWVYYPRLTADTIHAIVNGHLNPRIARLEAEAQAADQRGATDTGRAAAEARNEAADKRGLADDLRTMARDLLGADAAGYRPNLDDGCAVTAAPLAKLFPRGKWKDVTTKAFAALASGQTDWAHMAMAMWPKRVREACDHDASLAIAHGVTPPTSAGGIDPLGGGSGTSAPRGRGRPRRVAGRRPSAPRTSGTTRGRTPR